MNAIMKGLTAGFGLPILVVGLFIASFKLAVIFFYLIPFVALWIITR